MFIYLIFLSLTVALFITAALYDFFRLRIPNIIPIIITGCFFLSYFAAQLDNHVVFQSLSAHLMIGGIVFAIMLIMFFLKIMGGGDAKLIPAIALWVGTDGIAEFLFITILSGFPLAIIALLLKNTKIGHRISLKISHFSIFSQGWIKALANQQNVVPYGIAIAVGGIASFRTLGYLP